MGDVKDLTATKEELSNELRSNKRLLRDMLVRFLAYRIVPVSRFP